MMKFRMDDDTEDNEVPRYGEDEEETGGEEIVETAARTALTMRAAATPCPVTSPMYSMRYCPTWL